uniref:Zrp4 n=1 Tax=Arundo donax TaxID=35708 RepID=A0A0A9DGH1_ARUDO
MSRLLVGSQNLVPITAMILHPTLVAPFLELGAWFQRELPDPCVFKQKHGETLWELADRDAAFDALVNDGMVSDSHFIMDIAIKEGADAFRGISSLVDVGGGLGAAAQAISKAFPHVKCSVLDFDHVVAKAPGDNGVQYIAGDMFESVPPANAMFFKVTCPLLLLFNDDAVDTYALFCCTCLG